MIDKGSKKDYNSDNYNQNNNFNYGIIHENINGKFEFKFGAIWTIFIALFTILAIFGSEGINLAAIPFLGVFWYIGIYMLKNGLKKMKADISTEDFGEECFGRIYKLSSAGSTNGNTYYRATIIAYLPKEGIVKFFNEDIGYNCYDFPEGTYLRLKYFQDDANIKEIVNENIIPEKIKNKLVIPENENEGIYNNSNSGVYNSSNNYYISDANTLKATKKILGIFLLLFGLMWTFVIAIVSFVSFATSGGSFLEMLFNIIFFGIFWIVGIGTIVGGLFLCFKKDKNIDGENYKNYESKEYRTYEKTNIDDNSDDFDPIQKL